MNSAGPLKMKLLTGAVDIGGTKIAVGVVDSGGRVLRKIELPTDVPQGFDNAMRRVRAALSECAQQAGVEMSGIGIGCAGEVSAATGTLGKVNNLPGWEGGNPVEVLAREFGVTVALENDADAAALGEVRWGSGKARSRVVFLTVGTGIGASVILEEKFIVASAIATQKLAITLSILPGLLAPAELKDAGRVGQADRLWRNGREKIRHPVVIPKKSQLGMSAKQRKRDKSGRSLPSIMKPITWVLDWPIL